MRRGAALAAAAALAVSAGISAQDKPMPSSAAAPAPDAKLLERARALHKQVPLTDGHNDIPWAMRNANWYDFNKIDIKLPQPTLMTDIPRLRQGGLGAQFWSVYVPSALQGQKAVTATMEQIDSVYAMLRKYPDVFEQARTADDVERRVGPGEGDIVRERHVADAHPREHPQRPQ